MAAKLTTSVNALPSFCSIFFIISISYITAAAAHPLPHGDHKKVYIVYVVGSDQGHEAQYLYILWKVVGSEAASRIIYSYGTFNAFAAKLTDKERDQISKLKEVAFVAPERSVHPERELSLHHHLLP